MNPLVGAIPALSPPSSQGRLLSFAAFTVIFPFVARFLEDLHVTDDPSKIGYYAGAIESIFALTTFMTVLSWGRLSDRIGPFVCNSSLRASPAR